MDNLLKTYIKSENNVFQSEVWAKYQRELGHATFGIDCNGEEVLLIKLPLYRDFSCLYCPRAPQLSAEDWKLFVNKAKDLAEKEKCVYLRVEPFAVPSGTLKQFRFRPVRWYSPLSQQFSPMDTLLLDVSMDEEAILSQMKSKWRYNIKLSEKKDVVVRKSKSLDDLQKFYILSDSMTARGYNSFSLEHYKKLLQALGESNNLVLFVAEHEGNMLSAILVSYYNDVAIYLHGASSDDFRELMPNHLIQWAAILEAKKRGCKVYDFWGTAPEGVDKHKWSGITRFKIGFGGERVHFIGAFDYTFMPFWYTMFCLANVVRKGIRK